MTSKNKYLLNKVKLRVSRFVGQRLLSILVLLGLAQLGIKDLVNFLLDLDFYPRDNQYAPYCSLCYCSYYFSWPMPSIIFSGREPLP